MVNKSDCPFCFLSNPSEILIKNSAFIAKFDRYPVVDGHVLIIPKRHVKKISQLTKSEVLSLFNLLIEAQNYLLLKFSPDGFNIGINQGKAAGQTIEHLHVHLIPRFLGDVESPEGGIRRIVPNKVQYPTTIDL